MSNKFFTAIRVVASLLVSLTLVSCAAPPPAASPTPTAPLSASPSAPLLPSPQASPTATTPRELPPTLSPPTPTATATPSPTPQASSPREPAAVPLLVDTTWVVVHRSDEGVRIVDVREPAAYQEGHVPGAVNVPYGAFSLKVGNLTNELATEEVFASLMAAAGVGNDTRVVIYDAGNGLQAARLFWTLDLFGHAQNSLLNGGYGAWAAQGRQVSRETPIVAKAAFTARPDRTKLALTADILGGLLPKGTLLLDSRAAGEYAGADLRAARGGHIPDARNVDWQTTVVKIGDIWTFRDVDEIRKLYADAGLSLDQEIVTYCQSGVRAAHSYFTLKLAGYSRVRNYDASWEEWGNRTDTPIAK